MMMAILLLMVGLVFSGVIYLFFRLLGFFLWLLWEVAAGVDYVVTGEVQLSTSLVLAALLGTILLWVVGVGR